MTLFNPINSAGQSAFAPGVPRINAPEPREIARDHNGIEIDPTYTQHKIEYHFVDSVRLNRKGRTPGASKEPMSTLRSGE